MDKFMSIPYACNGALNVEESCKLNSSFSPGVLRIAYHGLNRNGTHISKEAFEAALPSLGNVPIVVHYLRQQDDLGGHDIQIVDGPNGQSRLVYLTDPVGVVPSSPNYWWEEIDDNGTMHEYLCVDVLMWKRQEAYQTIKESGVVGQSMEITILDGEDIDGTYYIHSFIFTALCLLGDNYEPCFESASLSVFGLSDFAAQYQQMLNEFKMEFANAGGINPTQEGGETSMNDDQNLSVSTIENPDESTVITNDNIAQNDPDTTNDSGNNTEFTMTIMAQLDELNRIVSSYETLTDSWGYEYSRFNLADVQGEEVIFYDAKQNWLPFGAPITESGDQLSVDFNQMKRKKVVYEDFTTTENVINWAEPVFTSMQDRINEAFTARDDSIAKYNELNDKYNTLYEAEQARKDAEHKAAVENVFDKFEKLLGGDPEFEALKSGENPDVQTLEDTCYSLYGKKKAVFTTTEKKQKNISLGIDGLPSGTVEEPYGSLFDWKKGKK